MKLGTLSLAYEALEELFKADLPIRIAYSLHKVIEPIRHELNDLEGMRLRLLEQHTKDSEIDREAFLSDYNELLEQDAKLTLPPIPLGDLFDSDVKISPLALNILISIGVLTED